MRNDALTVYIEFARLMVERDRRIYREIGMAGKLLEIKGLGNAMADVRDGMRGLKSLVADVSESASGFAAELSDVKAQIEQARDDLRFEAQTLGNSPPPAKPAPAPQQQPAPKVEPTATAEPVGGGLPPAPTFPAETTDKGGA